MLYLCIMYFTGFVVNDFFDSLVCGLVDLEAKYPKASQMPSMATEGVSGEPFGGA